ncbi:MAG TPA: ABC transporter ATP-binding protein [Micavibrio sp.]|nr:ABC transporter ATP-binding protein [Micavibrio sp.]HIL27634.1 ABC transporter ATP-binding protein [Micavibrio sp.]
MFLKSTNIGVHRKGSASLSFPDLSVDTGDSVLLLGPSGSGKTTLLSALAGLLKPSEGSVQIEGNDFYALSSAKRDQIRGQNFGFVFQTLHLLPSLTLRQNIALAADMAKASPDEGRLDKLIKDLGLTDKAHRKPDALSQGEQQRAAIARAVLLRPKVIMADEPTSALDDENAQKVMDLLEAQAKDTGAALLIATHDNRITNRFKNIITLTDQTKEVA